MSTVQKLNDFFEKDFAEYERNRMYPPNYPKGVTMPRPKLYHCYCIVRVINYLETNVNVADNPKLSASVEHDRNTLSEIKDILHWLIDNPTLPFAEHVTIKEQQILNPIEEEPNEAH